jgi:hypothetical protein
MRQDGSGGVRERLKGFARVARPAASRVSYGRVEIVGGSLIRLLASGSMSFCSSLLSLLLPLPLRGE